MKSIHYVKRIALYCSALTATLVLSSLPSQASPYASTLNYYASSNAVTFYLNEAGAKVLVTYEDGTTNDVYDGISAAATNVTRAQHSFYMTNSAAAGVNHVGYSIAVTKTGSGVPSLISSDSAVGSTWNSARGVAINKNPKNGSLFGRIYMLNSAAGAKPRGVFILNPDFTIAYTNTAVAAAGGIFQPSSASGPWRLRVAADDSVVINDFNGGTGNGQMLLFSPDLTSSNIIFGSSAALSANIHGDMFGTPQVIGSLATSNLVVWIADSGMAVPGPTVAPSIQLGPGTSPGMFNNVYRYDIGAGPLPWTNAPNYAFNYGLYTIAELTVDSDVAPDGKIFTGFGRANLSNPDVVVLDPTGLQVPLWSSWVNSQGLSDPFVPAGANYPYAGVRVSPDDKYFASMGINNAFIITKLTNGIPDLGTLFIITNTSSTGNARGMDWDRANNIYGSSSGQGLLRSYSLGNTTTCITSNDVTLTNGTFVVLLPPVTATAVATTPFASQGYGSPKVPVDGVITVNLTTNILTAPTVVAFTRSGSAAYLTNYTVNLGTNADGVIISSNSVTFPAGTWTHAGNWSADVHLTPTATPSSGPALTATFTFVGGLNYVVGTPLQASVVIANTGPQLLLVSPVGTAFSRGIPGDYVKFIITRWGDASVPDYTITNINYGGTAVYGTDFTAGAQTYSSGSLLADGAPGITIRSGQVSITNAIGNPVARANLNVAPTNVTVIITLTNASGTNLLAQNGFAYVVSATNSITLIENDNALGGNGNGGGMTLWSDPLTNAAASTNWTLTFATKGRPGVLISSTNVYGAAPPVVIPSYTNGETSVGYDPVNGTNDFDVQFGCPLPNNIPPSPAMVANGWTTVLRMTVNKNAQHAAAVNLYPHDASGQPLKFAGNYALKFSMYLSLWDAAIGTANSFGNFSGPIPIENAIVGINHYGTNCNWRQSITPATSSATQSGVTNSDGIWLTLGASDGVGTPADFDVFRPPAIPNAGMYNSGSPTISDLSSDAGSSHRNDFPNPPFTETVNVAGGEPVRKWVDVSAEISNQTNLVFKVDGFGVATVAFSGQGSGNTVWLASNNVPLTPYTNGDIMLGYQDPDDTLGDADSQFVYYSNVRVVELSPYITTHPVGVIVTNGSSASFLASAMYATAPLSGTWYQAASATAPTAVVKTDIGTTNLTTTLSVTNLQFGTNYVVIFSDAAGSVTSAVAQVEVVVGPTNVAAMAGATVQFSAIPNGPAAPTSYQWFTNGVPLANSAHYAGVTNATLTITNVQASDAVTYTVGVTNVSGVVLPSATLSVTTPVSPTLSGVTLVGTNAVLTFTSPNGFDDTNSYMLQSSVLVQGPYLNTAGTFTGTPGSFQVVVPLTTNTTMFYRLLHN